MSRKSKKKQATEEKTTNPGNNGATAENNVSVDQEKRDQTGDPSNTDNEDSDSGKPVSVEDESARIKNQYIRLMADFDNYRKRQSREREDFVKRSNEHLLGDILPMVDNLELALKKVSAPEDPFATGVKLVHEQFLGVLKRYGLTPIEAKGATFNPALHEALSYIPSPAVPANQIIDQFRCGWDLSGHLMRAAQVIVSSGKPDEDASQESISD